MPQQLTVHRVMPPGFNGDAAFILTLRAIFDRFQTGVTFLDGGILAVPNGSLEAVRIDDCSGAPTADVTQLFATFAAGLDPAREFVVFYANRLLDALGRPGASGCANCPPANRGVIVATGSRPLTLAHEVCHFYLGPGHRADSTNRNLMISQPQSIVGQGELTIDQVVQIRRGFAGLPLFQPELVAVNAVAPVRRRKRRPTPARKKRKKARAGQVKRSRRKRRGRQG